MTQATSESSASTSPLWVPSPNSVHNSQMSVFQRFVEKQTSLKFVDDQEFWKWSVSDRNTFWGLFWDFCEPEATARPSCVVDNNRGFHDVTWFEGVKLNYARNLLRFARQIPQHPAIIFEPEVGKRRAIAWNEMERAAASWASRFRSIGIKPGDRIAGYLPNIPEAVLSMLGASAIGATWSSTSPDFGFEGVVDRFSQIEPRALIVSDGYYYQGKWHALNERLQTLLERLPSVEVVYLVPYSAELAPALEKSFALKNQNVHLKIINTADDVRSNSPLVFEELDFDHPLFILYSSGTTGKPKCIVHGAGGTLLQHLKEHRLHTDLRPQDSVFYFTTCGWMMWNWLVSALATGCTICLYDGSPLYPDVGRLFGFAKEEGMRVFGTSARYLTSLMQAGFQLTDDLPKLEIILSTGSPLAPACFEYVYSSIKKNLCLASISGGTDIVSCFALGNPRLPIFSGELQSIGLGMAVEVFDDSGSSVDVGSVGELVCTKPFPSRPVYFWNDPDGRRYHRSYFERYPGTWHHGDWVAKTKNDGLIIYGRSDAVLNPGGVRIGTAELYRQTEQLDYIVESVAVGQSWENDERIILFVKLQDGEILTEERKTEIAALIRKNLTPRHVPKMILAIKDIPRTVNGKLSEIAVRETIHGREVKNRKALINPESLAHFANIQELKGD